MNIFVLDTDPKKAARCLSNKHCVKMVLESAQMLCNAHPVGVPPYKHTHRNHPCSVWTRQTTSNYAWLIEHALELSYEYTRRYKKIHKTQAVIEWCASHVPEIITGTQTPFVQAMPEKYKKNGDAVAAYREYYVQEKQKIAKWKPRSTAPKWWPYQEQ